MKPHGHDTGLAGSNIDVSRRYLMRSECSLFGQVIQTYFGIDWPADARSVAALLVAIDGAANPSSHDRIADAPEEASGQVAITHRGLAPRDGPDIIAGPREAVPFGDNDPRSVTRQPKIPPDGVRHFDRQLIAGRGLGGQRHDVHLIDPVLRTGHQNDRDGPVLYTFIPAFNVLVFPQVAVVEDFTRLRQR